MPEAIGEVSVMVSLRERIVELRAIRQQQPEVQMLSIGVPKWMAVAGGLMALMLLLQGWTKHVGRIADVAGAGAVSHPPAHFATGLERVYYAPGDDLSGIDAKLIGGAMRTLDVAADGELDDTLCRAIGLVSRRGASVRVLRDADSLAVEKNRVGGSCSEGLGGIGVAVRVRSGPMELHSFVVDGGILRSGTAGFGSHVPNTAEEINVVRSADAVNDFERTFSRLWDEPNNRIVRTDAGKTQ